MAISTFIAKTSAVEQLKIVVANSTLDSSYPTGGYAVVPSDFGLRGIFAVVAGSPPLGGFVATYDAVAGKVKLFQSTTGAPAALVEVANATNVATSIVPLVVFGFA
jgi:hypothetical protein